MSGLQTRRSCKHYREQNSSQHSKSCASHFPIFLRSVRASECATESEITGGLLKALILSHCKWRCNAFTALVSTGGNFGLCSLVTMRYMQNSAQTKASMTKAFFLRFSYCRRSLFISRGKSLRLLKQPASDSKFPIPALLPGSPETAWVPLSYVY